MTISEWLTHDPQTKRQLAEKTGYSTRDVELLIQAARLEGVPICSNGDGYWLARNSAEIANCAARLRSRAAHQFVTARAMRRAAQRMAVSEAAPLSFEWR